MISKEIYLRLSGRNQVVVVGFVIVRVICYPLPERAEEIALIVQSSLNSTALW
jgi:hypothetical protein